MTTPDEMRFSSTRIDPQFYADQALDDLLTHDLRGLRSARSQAYVRDALAESFEAGEHQGTCRAILILTIAKANATDPQVAAAMEACLKVLVPE